MRGPRKFHRFSANELPKIGRRYSPAGPLRGLRKTTKPARRPEPTWLHRSHGPSGPRRKCGVRRREPAPRATGVYQIKGATAAPRAVGNKETVPPGGTREKSSGPGSWPSYMKPKRAPTPHRAREMRPHPAQISRLKRRGLRGNMVPPSNRARPAVRCRTAFPQKCRDCGGVGAHFIFM